MNPLKCLLEDLYLIDGFDLGIPYRTGSYIFTGDTPFIIETSASPSIPHILKGLEQLSIAPDQIKYIIVTHIHLDHAGGAGLLLQHCQNAKVIVHPKGARHLNDPSRLIKGAQAVYGDKFDELFHPIVPIPEDRLITMAHEEQLMINSSRTLSFYHTPGHAHHHFSIFDSQTNSMFTGDTAGVTYPLLAEKGIHLYLPSTSPNQFDPDLMLKSISLYEALPIEQLMFGHFGMVKNTELVYNQVRQWLSLFLKEAQDAFNTESSIEIQQQIICQNLLLHVTKYLEQQGFNETDSVKDVLKTIQLDLNVSTMGLIDYLAKRHSA